ncbi:MAG TPA: ATP-binding protein [Actinomycetota bacterium]|nr:ATP-binding protein [Actinomycetota bacterium]
MRPLDPLSSIKIKLGVVIVVAVGVTVLALGIGFRLGLPRWASAIGAAAVALAMIQFLARGMTSPLREMAAASEAMARGDYSQRVTATSRDEVGRLAIAFNRMAAELAEVDRMRRDLVANVSHELRTPISALQAVLENVLDGVEEADDETVGAMLKQVERLGRLVSQLLDLSRLESGTVPLQKAEFPARALLDDVAREAGLNLDAREKNVTVEVSPQTDGVSIVADRERVHQVVANLVDNAIRHSPSGGRVSLEADVAGEGVSLRVTDEGPGIDPAELDRVFERFYRSDRARAASDGGSGLGLSIARWIVELHGGDIRVDPRVTRGCTMLVTLPGPGS